MITETAMTPATRVAALVTAVHDEGWTLEFVAGVSAGAVHVVGPDEDQPTAENDVEWMMWRIFRGVCGQLLWMGPLDGVIGTFDDARLCTNCHKAFQRLGNENDRALIFLHNTEAEQDSHSNATIRQSRQMREDRQAALKAGAGQ